MFPTMSSLGIDKLSMEQRGILAQEIFDSITPPPPLDPLLPEQQDELDRRDAELEANPGMAMSWDEFQSRLARKS